ncbi:anti-sigma factor family protein [Brevibacillus sp. TJ4]|uniref:anti-sigma factor family protein n=1 Tax=Brevibacillus sp. TJ4 TaxID=3234853 RepID=UPI0037CD7235
MMCREEGFIQAYLDGECGAEEGERFTEHLHSCESCQQKLDELARLEAWSKEKLDEMLSTPTAPLRVDADAAWQRFSEKIGSSKKTVTMQAFNKNQATEKRGWKAMKKQTRRWVMGMSAAAVVAVSLSFPQVQAAASDLLSIFRVNKVEFVKLSEEDLRQAEYWISRAEGGEFDLNGIGKVWIDENDQAEQRSVWYDSVEEAEQAGVKLPVLPDGVKVTGVDVVDAFTIYMELDVEKANQLFAQLQMKERFDEGLNGERFSMHVPESMSLSITEGDNHFNYQIVGALQLEAPEGVDLDNLRETVLALPFIPDNVKKQMLAIDNWQQTLPIPYVESDDNRVKEVKVGGNKGLLFSSDHRTNLVWQENGTLHYVDGYEVKEEQILNLVEKLKQ